MSSPTAFYGEHNILCVDYVLKTVDETKNQVKLSIRIEKDTRLKTPNVGKELGQLGLSNPAGGTVNWYNPQEKHQLVPTNA